MGNARNPNGFCIHACINSPDTIDLNDAVIPQEGQGNPVVLWNKQITGEDEGLNKFQIIHPSDAIESNPNII